MDLVFFFLLLIDGFLVRNSEYFFWTSRNSEYWI